MAPTSDPPLLVGHIPNCKLKVFSGRANIPLAEKIALCLGDPLGKITLSNFPDGEISVRIEEDVRGRDVFVVQPTCPPVNENLMELLIMLDSFKRASAARITAVLPYYGYARQDRKDVGRVPITAKLVANLLTSAGADRVAGARPARRPDSGLLRHPRRSPPRRPGHQRLHSQPGHPAESARGAQPRRRQHQAGPVAPEEARRGHRHRRQAPLQCHRDEAGQPDRRVAGGQGGGHLRRHDLDGQQRGRAPPTWRATTGLARCMPAPRTPSCAARPSNGCGTRRSNRSSLPTASRCRPISNCPTSRCSASRRCWRTRSSASISTNR